MPHATPTRRAALPLLMLFSSSADAPLTRQLGRVLHLLSVTAAVLGIVLGISLAGAVWAYRRNHSREPRP